MDIIISLCQIYAEFLSFIKPKFYLKDPRVVDAMIPYMVNSYGNPHSKTHFYGWEAEKAVEGARLQVKKFG